MEKAMTPHSSGVEPGRLQSMGSLRVGHDWVTSHSLFTFTQSKSLAVNKAKVDVFLELSCFFNDATDVGNLISGSSAFSKSSWIIWKFSVHIPLKPHLENLEHYFANIWVECNCAVVWTFFSIAFLWDWNAVLWPLLSFPNLLAYWMQHYHSIIF